MATAVEQFGRDFDGSRATKVYYIHNATGEDDARTTLIAAADATWEAGGETLYLDEDGTRVYENNGVWYGELSYVPLEEVAGGGGGEDSAFEFDTTGGTQHLMTSYGTVAAKGTRGTATAAATDNGNLIGVVPGTNGHHGSVEGVDVGVGQLGFTITKSFAIADVDSDYINDLRDITFTTNEADFSGTTDDGIDFDFGIGEVLFQGARGGVQNGRVVITFYFAAGENLIGATIGTITDIDKAAWDYLWVIYDDAEVASAMLTTPVAVYVDVVYLSSDFSLLAII